MNSAQSRAADRGSRIASDTPLRSKAPGLIREDGLRLEGSEDVGEDSDEVEEVEGEGGEGEGGEEDEEEEEGEGEDDNEVDEEEYSDEVGSEEEAGANVSRSSNQSRIFGDHSGNNGSNNQVSYYTEKMTFLVWLPTCPPLPPPDLNG